VNWNVFGERVTAFRPLQYSHNREKCLLLFAQMKYCGQTTPHIGYILNISIQLPVRVVITINLEGSLH